MPTLEARRRDVYAELLRETRGLRRDQSQAREEWYRTLPWNEKEETLFELEMLLKSFACFTNAHNQPGPNVEATAPAGHDYAGELRIVRDALERTVQIIRRLLGRGDRAYVFSRYLEVVMPNDELRSRLINEQLSQQTPQDSLFVLRTTFGSLLEVADGLCDLQRVPHRTYFGFVALITREVSRNVYFNPLITLEFRPEFDRIPNADVLEVLHRVPPDAHRTVAITLLTLFRARRYLRLADQYAERERMAALAYPILSVLRSDLRAMTGFLASSAGDSLAQGLENVIWTVPASSLQQSFLPLRHRAHALRHLSAILQGLSSRIRADTRRIFERELPLVDAIGTESLGPAIILATAQLRTSIHHAIVTLCHELVRQEAGTARQEEGSASTHDFEPKVNLSSLESDVLMARHSAARFRQELWMFRQIVRAFLAKSEAAAQSEDTWTSRSSFEFVSEFLRHFRAIGYQLARERDYPHLERCVALLESLKPSDFFDPQRSQAVLQEMRALDRYLAVLFDQVQRRHDLKELPFDRGRAAVALRYYLAEPLS